MRLLGARDDNFDFAHDDNFGFARDDTISNSGNAFVNGLNQAFHLCSF